MAQDATTTNIAGFMDISSLAVVDYVVLSMVGISVLFGFFKGFISSILSFTGWLVAIYLTYFLFPYVRPYLDEKFHNPLITFSLGYIGVLFALLILCSIINLLIRLAVGGMHKDIFDRSIGALFGLFRGAFIVSFLFLCLSALVNIRAEKTAVQNDQELMPEWLTKAQSYTMMIRGRDYLMQIIPQYYNFQEANDVVNNSQSEDTIDDRTTNEELNDEESEAI